MATERATERSVYREYLEALIIAAIFLQFANHFVLQTFYIPSGSMENTLLVGDHLFVNRFIYGPSPGASTSSCRRAASGAATSSSSARRRTPRSTWSSAASACRATSSR